jgi:hypothetical protein
MNIGINRNYSVPIVPSNLCPQKILYRRSGTGTNQQDIVLCCITGESHACFFWNAKSACPKTLHRLRFLRLDMLPAAHSPQHYPAQTQN